MPGNDKKESKEAKPEKTPTAPHEASASENIPKAVVEKKMAPWEHFKQSRNFKNYKSHGQANMNRRTGGRGG
jgi:hypothetical protein